MAMAMSITAVRGFSTPAAPRRLLGVATAAALARHRASGLLGFTTQRAHSSGRSTVVAASSNDSGGMAGAAPAKPVAHWQPASSKHSRRAAPPPTFLCYALAPGVWPTAGGLAISAPAAVLLMWAVKRELVSIVSNRQAEVERRCRDQHVSCQQCMPPVPPGQLWVVVGPCPPCSGSSPQHCLLLVAQKP